MTLKEAIEKVLRQVGDKPMIIEDIKSLIQQDGLFTKKRKPDTPLRPWQIAARATNSPEQLEVLVPLRK